MERRVVSLFVDFFDSYSYNIVHYLRKVNGAEPIVVHPGELTIDDFVRKYYPQVDNVVISPGYGNPQTGGRSRDDLIAGMLERKIDIPILGICFGHQLICHLYGCKIKKVKNMFHGDTNIIHICKYENIASDLFENVQDGFKATCYNSLKVSKRVPDPLRITCYSLCGEEFIVMGTQHKYLPYYTVQYHPESIESDFSDTFFENFKKITLKRSGGRRGGEATVNYTEHQLWSNLLQGGGSFELPPNERGQKAWKIKIIKLSGVHNLRNFSHAIFRAIFYDPNDVSFWLDSNGEVLDAPPEGYYSKGEGIQHEGDATRDRSGIHSGHVHSSHLHANHLHSGYLHTSCRFSYMGNAKGRLSELLEYYYAENGGGHQMNGTIVQLGKRSSEESYRVTHYSEDPDNCLVHHMRDRINLFKGNYNIHLEEVKMEKCHGTFNQCRTGRGENMTNFSTGGEAAAEEAAVEEGQLPPDGYPYEGYLPKGAIQEDQFVRHRNSCLLGYFGFFTYEYNYETMKILYKKKWKNHAQDRESKNAIPISVFIFPQNFISLDLVNNNIYLISLEPKDAYFKSPLGHSPTFWSSQDVHNVLQYNARWNHEAIHKIVRIVKTKLECDQHCQVPSFVCITPPECFPYHEQLPHTNEANENKIVFSPLVGKDEYMENVKRCKEYIEMGHSYELCLTTQFVGYYFVSDSNAPSVDSLNMYLHVRRVNKVAYSCYIHYWRKMDAESVPFQLSSNPAIDEELQFTVMCISPEEFLRKDKDDILFSKPIKGTIRRGKSNEEDSKMKEKLLNSKKDRAENLMIVDLTTNDLHRICQIDTVRVSHLFQIESYAYLHQMVSQIYGRLLPGKTFADAIVNVFPGGSMTGAPKPISISLLQSIEKAPRGVYSGSIGFISVEGNFILNIVIRTAVVQNRAISIGAGGAVTIKSDETEEYNEMLLKFMSVARPIW
ncbi:hypothetical protein C922_01660 [Plasmodium inui San Antonio 1]|uniref:aminodeoxychorismate synthase n=1 Tax=Plasmodium inui San Antonio 1 TaxID=1237626 RepID=W7A9X2_9APIC|nr:hypothetical protein C922_01660 [Plasmodium inui San Antonio 1]EUD68048.1 hypothetical protein C922_01660 [Plasmodium inui San Antonio 1]